MIKQIPYGLTDFGRIQKENYYYVDKTMFIEKIEMQPSYLFLIRPRRFGKSLTLAMLEAYYDVRYADQFDELFGHLYIGQHPTPIHNQFLIMRFNFSVCIVAGSFLILFIDTSICWEKTFGMFWMKKRKRIPAPFCPQSIPMLPVRETSKSIS